MCNSAPKFSSVFFFFLEIPAIFWPVDPADTTTFMRTAVNVRLWVWWCCWMIMLCVLHFAGYKKRGDWEEFSWVFTCWESGKIRRKWPYWFFSKAFRWQFRSAHTYSLLALSSRGKNIDRGFRFHQTCTPPPSPVPGYPGFTISQKLPRGKCDLWHVYD
jgi:hypothetical protein